MASMPLFKLFFFFLSLLAIANAKGLKVGFYKATCPKAEKIILEEMIKIMSVAPSLAAPLLRLHFHDCFVNGCDASVLLNGTKNNPAEKDAPPNFTLRGYSTIDRIKAKLEEACPGIVSCADVLAIVARDAVFLTKGPFYDIPTGRRDGSTSPFSTALSDLPRPVYNFSQLQTNFSSKGLTLKDLVVLSGGHTIGTSHCSTIAPRLYNFTGKGDADPTLDPNYVAKLKVKCKPNDATSLVEMDPGSVKKFDTSFFKLVAKRRSLFTSDDSLLTNPTAKKLVFKFANSPKELFFQKYAVSMVKMGNVGVLTRKQGEIRKHCAKLN